MSEYVTRFLRCPVCGTGFGADEPRRAEPAARDADFHPVHDGPSPLFSAVACCPACRYCALPEGFVPSAEDEEDPPSLSDDPPGLARPATALPDEDDLPGMRRWIRAGEMTQGIVAPGEEPFGATRFLVAERVREYLVGDDAAAGAWFVLHAAWCARETGDAALESRLLGQLPTLLDAAAGRDGLGGVERLRLAYLAGETSRRTGDYARAVDLLGRVEASADVDEEDGVPTAELARRQGLLARVGNSVCARIPAGLSFSGRAAGEPADAAGAPDDADD